MVVHWKRDGAVEKMQNVCFIPSKIVLVLTKGVVNSLKEEWKICILQKPLHSEILIIYSFKDEKRKSKNLIYCGNFLAVKINSF